MYFSESLAILFLNQYLQIFKLLKGNDLLDLLQRGARSFTEYSDRNMMLLIEIPNVLVFLLGEQIFFA